MSDSILKAVTFSPGIMRNETAYMAEGGWVDCDWVRFRHGRPEKNGGWTGDNNTQVTDATNSNFTGVARDILSWTDLSLDKFLAVATHLKIELRKDDLIYDITPVRDNVTPTNVIDTTSGLSTVNITSTTHNLAVGDYIFVNSQASPVDGITLSGSYIVTVVTDANNFTVDSGTTASGSTANGGGALDIDFLLESGSQSNGDLTGWSGGTWNTEGASGQGWNRPRSGVGGLNLRQVSLDTFGEDLLACVRNGKMYKWDATNGPTVRLQELSTLVGATQVPQENLFVLVSQPTRHVIAFGSEVLATGVFDPLIIRWADQESTVDWDVTDTNSAGEYRLPKGNTIIGAVQTRGEIVVFTDTDSYSMRYVGGIDVFQFEPLGTNVSSISQHGGVDVNGVIFWMGLDDFYMYDGVIQPIPSTINKFIFDQDGEGRINTDQKEKIFAGVNKDFHEVWWLYPSFDSVEIDRYVVYNYQEGLWYYGTLDRTVWMDKSIFDKPIALDEAGKLYSHEVGKDADGAPLPAFILSSYFDMEDGGNIMFVDRIIPDIRLPDNRSVKISVLTKKYPHPTAKIITKGPFSFDDGQDELRIRARGRQMALKYEVDATGSDFEIGKVRLGMQLDGGR